jgi:OmpA-OmpF porin, OOP family
MRAFVLIASTLVAGAALAQGAGLERAKRAAPDVYATVTFGLGSAELDARALAILDRAAVELAADPAPIEVAGHTDASGTEAVNVQLAATRADAVLRHLVARGIARERLTAVAYGAREPVDSNATATGRAYNRRVELKLAE